MYKLKFCKKIKVSVGPALRFNHLFSQKFNVKRKYNILISLNLDLIESKKILTSVIDTKYGQSGETIFVKPHPLLPLSKIINEKLIPNLRPKRTNIVDGKMSVKYLNL